MMPHLSSDDNDNNVCYNTSVDVTPSIHTSFNIENEYTHKEKTAKKKEAPASTRFMGNPKHVAKGFLLFVVSVAATGFLYMASQAVVSATATTGENQKYIEPRWWFSVDAIELLFYMFVLSALFHFVVNAGGGSKIKHWFIFVPLVLTTGIILVVVAPGVYQQAHNDIVNIPFGRGQCQSFNQVDKKFGLLKAYPSLHIKRDRFLQYNFNNRTDVETRVFIDGLGRMVAIADADLLRQMAISTSIPAAERQRLLLLKIKSFLVKECAYKMLDVMCADRFKLCNVLDCALPSNSCFKQNVVALLHDWEACGKEKCTYNVDNDTNWCASINDQIMIDDIIPAHDFLMSYALELGIVNQITQHLFSDTLVRLSKYLLESMSNHSETCNMSNVKGPDHAFMQTNVTCDITKHTYSRGRISVSFNSTALVLLVLAVFGCAVPVFGDYKTLYFHLSAVRVGCCMVGLLMGALVYVGSLHLYWSSVDNPVKSDADLQMMWRALYLVISYMCLHGGLLVLVPNVAAVNGDQNKQQTAAVNQDLFCSSCGNATCCRRGTFCFKTLHFLKSLKEELWDASGKWYVLKLMLMEMVEVAIQINSLTSGAKTSHVDDVVLSAIIIAANLVVLPLVLVLGPKCIKSSASSSDVSIAAVMVVELLFDKLYVGVGVFLRYDTLTRRNMTAVDQLSVHLALLLPALMTALDVQDALVLAEHMEATSASFTNRNDNIADSTEREQPDSYRSSTFARIAGQVDLCWLRIRAKPIFLLGKVSLFTSVIIGLMLATYTLVVSTAARAECKRRIGTIASCAAEQYYFTNGFFQPTDCAFEQVISFKCKAGDSVAALPDVVDEYALMANLILINISNSKTLDRAPVGWAYVPNEKLTIDLHDSQYFSDLPFQLCSSDSNLTSIDLRGTAAETTIDWNSQVSAANFTSFGVDSLNHACIVALKKITSLSLADNGLNTNSIDEALVLQFDSLIHLDLRRNNITKIDVLIGENVFAPVLQRYMFSNSTTSGLGGLQIENNPIKQYWINAEARVTIVEEWIRILSLLPSVLDVKFAGCNIDDKQFQRIVEALQKHNSTVEFLNVGGNQISDTTQLAALNKLKILHMTGNAIVDVSGLRNLSSLKYLDLSINGIRSVEPIRQLINLEQLFLYDNQLSDLSTLEMLVNLKTLHVKDNKLATTRGLGTFIGLEELNVGRNELTNVSMFGSGSFDRLEVLWLAENQITDVACLGNLPRLSFLDLQKNPINATDIAALQGELHDSTVILF